jgi:hypothetical protein
MQLHFSKGHTEGRPHDTDMHPERTQIHTDPALLLLLQRQQSALSRAHKIAVQSKKAVERLTGDHRRAQKPS